MQSKRLHSFSFTFYEDGSIVVQASAVDGERLAGVLSDESAKRLALDVEWHAKSYQRRNGTRDAHGFCSACAFYCERGKAVPDAD